MTVASQRAAFSRTPIWLLKLVMDCCANEYGAAPCTASGGHCHYTWFTCKDTANYSKTTRDWKFTTRNAAQHGPNAIHGAWPLLKKDFAQVPTEIKPDRFTVERGKMTFDLAYDDAALFSYAAKTTSPADTGKFWPNWLARNKNYKHRVVELYEGYAGIAEAAFELYWRGTIDDIHIDKTGAKIECFDLLYKFRDLKTPPKIDTATNTVQDAPLLIGATAVTVADVTEFVAADANHPRAIKIESEYIAYTGRNLGTNQLTGCTRGALGSAAAEHAAGTEIKPVLFWGATNGVTGWSPDRIFLDLVCKIGGLAPAYLATVDYSMAVSGAINDSVTSLVLSDASALPTAGCLLINSELVYFTSRSANTLTILRGMFGTTAAAHADTDAVHIVSASDEIGRWQDGLLFKRITEKEQTVTELILSLSSSTMIDVFPNEDGKIQWNVQAPAAGAASLTEISRAETWLDSRSVNQNEDSRVTRMIVAYGATAVDPGDDDYADFSAYVGAEEENVKAFGSPVPKIIYSPWIYRPAEADWLASHLFQRYRRATPIIGLSVELHNNDIELGDLVRMAVPEIVDEDGAEKTLTYRVVYKKPERGNEIALRCAGTGFGSSSYGLIGPVLPTLDAGISDVATAMDLDLGAGYVFSDFRAAGGQFRIEDEMVTSTGVTDLGGGTVRISGLTRGVDGTVAAAHLAAALVIPLYSAVTDAFRDQYAHLGDASNDLDADGDLTEETEGYLIW